MIGSSTSQELDPVIEKGCEGVSHEDYKWIVMPFERFHTNQSGRWSETEWWCVGFDLRQVEDHYEGARTGCEIENHNLVEFFPLIPTSLMEWNLILSHMPQTDNILGSDMRGFWLGLLGKSPQHTLNITWMLKNRDEVYSPLKVRSRAGHNCTIALPDGSLKLWACDSPMRVTSSGEVIIIQRMTYSKICAVPFAHHDEEISESLSKPRLCSLPAFWSEQSYGWPSTFESLDPLLCLKSSAPAVPYDKAVSICENNYGRLIEPHRLNDTRFAAFVRYLIDLFKIEKSWLKIGEDGSHAALTNSGIEIVDNATNSIPVICYIATQEADLIDWSQVFSAQSSSEWPSLDQEFSMDEDRLQASNVSAQLTSSVSSGPTMSEARVVETPSKSLKSKFVFEVGDNALILCAIMAVLCISFILAIIINSRSKRCTDCKDIHHHHAPCPQQKHRKRRTSSASLKMRPWSVDSALVLENERYV